MSAEYLRALKEQVSGYAGTWKDFVMLARLCARLVFDLLHNPHLAVRHGAV